MHNQKSENTIDFVYYYKVEKKFKNLLTFFELWCILIKSQEVKRLKWRHSSVG